MSCQIVGNWVGSYLLARTSGANLFLIAGSTIAATSFGFCFLRDPEPIDETKPDFEEDEDQSFWETTVETVRFTFRGKMWLVLPLLFTSGISISYF